MNDPDDEIPSIDFYKYLNCPDCKECWAYCPKHKIEVEKILAACNYVD